MNWIFIFLFGMVKNLIQATLLTNTQSLIMFPTITQCTAIIQFGVHYMPKSFKQGNQHVEKYPVTMSYHQHLIMPLSQEVRQLISPSPGFAMAPFLSIVHYKEANRKRSFLPHWFTVIYI